MKKGFRRLLSEIISKSAWWCWILIHDSFQIASGVIQCRSISVHLVKYQWSSWGEWTRQNSLRSARRHWINSPARLAFSVMWATTITFFENNVVSVAQYEYECSSAAPEEASKSLNRSSVVSEPWTAPSAHTRHQERHPMDFYQFTRIIRSEIWRIGSFCMQHVFV